MAMLRLDVVTVLLLWPRCGGVAARPGGDSALAGRGARAHVVACGAAPPSPTHFPLSTQQHSRESDRADRGLASTEARVRCALALAFKRVCAARDDHIDKYDKY